MIKEVLDICGGCQAYLDNVWLRSDDLLCGSKLLIALVLQVANGSRQIQVPVHPAHMPCCQRMAVLKGPPNYFPLAILVHSKHTMTCDAKIVRCKECDNGAQEEKQPCMAQRKL